MRPTGEARAPPALVDPLPPMLSALELAWVACA